MSDDRKLSISRRGRSGGSADQSPSRAGFGGRGRTVVVERKRRKLARKPGPEQAEEAKKPEPEEKKPEAKKEEAREETLTNEEVSTRTEALKDAIRQAEEERRRAAEEKRKREEAARRREREEKEGKEKESAAADEDADEEARKRAEEDAKRKSEMEARRKAEAEAQKLEEERLAKLEAKKAAEAKHAPSKKEPDERDEDFGKKKGKKKPHVQDRRRSGKLTVTTALEEGDDRQPSLAALKRKKAKKKKTTTGSDGKQRRVREVVIPEALTVQELSNRMAERAADVIKTLMNLGVMATINETLDQDTAELVATEMGHEVKRVSEADVEIGLEGEKDDPKDMKPRPPVVTVMGHVDHGKTSLLDAMRETDVAAGEAGGITQHIGAYQVQLKDGGKVTFLDTPGHEAFTAMRARGASITDIVILVVSADDGVMPQTVEAINHARAAKVPIIVAINKIDKEGANPDKVRNDLLQHEVVVESMSGDVLEVEVSALKKQGLDNLIDAIGLQAELLELKANPDRPAEGVVIEARLDKGRGPVATVLVRRGTLKTGDIFVAGAEWGRVRALVNERGQSLKEAGPSQPVEILGLNGAPSAGDDFAVVEDEARAREISEYRQGEARKRRVGGGPASLESMFSALKEQQATEFPIVLKGDVQGSVEAIIQALEKISTDEIRAQVIHAAVGGITETDVTLAKASGAMIIGFNVRANKQARETAEKENVTILYYSIIYDLVDGLKQLLSGELAPRIEERTLGRAEVRDTFRAGKAGTAAGCMVLEGSVRKDAKARITRDDKVVFEGSIESLRRFQDEVNEVKAGTECGIKLANFEDIKPGDDIEIYEEVEVERTL